MQHSNTVSLHTTYYWVVSKVRGFIELNDIYCALKESKEIPGVYIKTIPYPSFEEASRWCLPIGEAETNMIMGMSIINADIIADETFYTVAIDTSNSFSKEYYERQVIHFVSLETLHKIFDIDIVEVQK